MKAARSNMSGAGLANSNFKYSRLAADDDGYIDLQVSHFILGHYPLLSSVTLYCCRQVNPNERLQCNNKAFFDC